MIKFRIQIRQHRQTTLNLLILLYTPYASGAVPRTVSGSAIRISGSISSLNLLIQCCTERCSRTFNAGKRWNKRWSDRDHSIQLHTKNSAVICTSSTSSSSSAQTTVRRRNDLQIRRKLFILNFLYTAAGIVPVSELQHRIQLLLNSVIHTKLTGISGTASMYIPMFRSNLPDRTAEHSTLNLVIRTPIPRTFHHVS